MNTPSGTNITALDKFILSYIIKGYDWLDRAKATYFTPSNTEGKRVKNRIGWLTQSDNDIVFFKDGSVITAEAVLDDRTNHITGYVISIVK